MRLSQLVFVVSFILFCAVVWSRVSGNLLSTLLTKSFEHQVKTALKSNECRKPKDRIEELLVRTGTCLK